MKNKQLLKFTLIVIIFMIFLGSSLWIFLQTKPSADSARIAKIYQNDQLIGTYDLSAQKVIESIVITAKNGGSNTIEIRPGSIGIIDASCPDHICMDIGFISDSLMPITCLPNQLMILVEDAAVSGIDAVSQ